jgi:hypothetical protein
MSISFCDPFFGAKSCHGALFQPHRPRLPKTPASFLDHLDRAAPVTIVAGIF